jgi:hypothetical protein
VVVRPISHEVFKSKVSCFGVMTLYSQVQVALVFEVLDIWDLKLYLGPVFRVWLREVEELLKDICLVHQNMEDTVATRKDVETKFLHLLEVDFIEIDLILAQFRDQLPVEESERVDGFKDIPVLVALRPLVDSEHNRVDPILLPLVLEEVSAFIGVLDPSEALDDFVLGRIFRAVVVLFYIGVAHLYVLDHVVL